MVPIGPSIAAVVMIGLFDGRQGLRRLVRSLLHVRIGRWWSALLLPVAVVTGATAIAVLAGGSGPDAGDIGSAVAAALISLPLILVVAGPVGEELGWRGYVLPTLLRRHGPVTATLILTPMWIAFHLPWIINRPERFGAAWALALVGMALTMTWLHLRTGSLALAVTFHAVVNSVTPAALQLFPEPERATVWAIAAALWLLAGLTTALGPLRGPHFGDARQGEAAAAA